MTVKLRNEIETIFHAALEPVRADHAVRANIGREADGEVTIGGHPFGVEPDGVYVIAIGKAAVTMIDAAAGSLGELFTAGIAVTKAEDVTNEPRTTVLHGSHPVPDERSLAAGDAVLRFAEAVPANALVVCLISGGGSALVERLRDDIRLDQLRELTSALLKAGASIHELNAVRSRLSRIKAGGLLRALAHARVCNLIMSDVLGDDIKTIASGPTVPPVQVDADAVLRRYRVPGPIPDPVEHDDLTMPPTTVIANLSMALDAAAQAATGLGYEPVILSRTLDGEAREAGRLLAAIVADGAAGAATFGRRTCLLAGGETTVTVRGDGVGGRNTEAALAAAIRLSGATGAAIGFLATDGDDGCSGAAGGIVDGETVRDDRRQHALASLANSDSFTFLHERGAACITVATGTNVNDLVIGLIE